jgi:hypothetical protein
VRRIDFEYFGGFIVGGGIAEEGRRLLIDYGVVAIGADDFTKILVDGFLIVDNQDPDYFLVAHVSTSTGLKGKSTVNFAPRPGPSL